MKILVACEMSGAVRTELTKNGHFALSCDLLPSEAGEAFHYQGDVFDIITFPWDAMIAFPPCTYLCNSGVRWLYNRDGSRNEERWRLMVGGAWFFKRLWEAPIPIIVMENPIMHKYAKEIIFGDNPVEPQIIQPYQFGHTEKKKTCLWIKGLPPLKGTKNVFEAMRALPVRESQKVHHMAPGPTRAIDRARTYKGIAEAMASQWFPGGDL